MDSNNNLHTMYWENDCLFLLDQRLLPHKAEYRSCSSYREVISSIRDMTVRGAPAIGISAAYAMVLAAKEAEREGLDRDSMHNYLQKAATEIGQARPTAVNLAWAIDRQNKWLREHQDVSQNVIIKGLEREAISIHREDIDNNRLIGRFGAALVPEKASILTHCNAGALATGGYGTALGVIRAAAEEGKDIHVFVDETRPLLQGARITAFELCHENIAATLVSDSCAGYLMALGRVDLVVVGADRIAGNGDAANKIGTFSLAVLAAYHKIPFYIAAPLSTIDLTVERGTDIIIEERDSREITHLNEELMAPVEIKAYNPAFDLTPAELITAVITEKGIVRKPNREKIKGLFSS